MESYTISYKYKGKWHRAIHFEGDFTLDKARDDADAIAEEQPGRPIQLKLRYYPEPKLSPRSKLV